MGWKLQGIKEIKHINMNRDANGLSKTFSGTVQANLEILTEFSILLMVIFIIMAQLLLMAMYPLL